jgi:uncharacterized protein (DUF2141 family)
MSKFRFCLIGLPLVFAAPAGATVLGPDAGVCARGDGPAILVNVVGFKNRAGSVRARTFGGSPSTWFDKKHYLKRTLAEVPSSGAVAICMPVPGPGTYAVDIRHDINANGDTDKADGAGASGNPKISLFDVVFGRRPPAAKVSVQVGTGVTPITIVLKYLSGGSVQPVQITSGR